MVAKGYNGLVTVYVNCDTTRCILNQQFPEIIIKYIHYQLLGNSQSYIILLQMIFNKFLSLLDHFIT